MGTFQRVISAMAAGKERFYLMIGQNGCILTYVNNGLLKKRLYAPSFSEADPIKTLLASLHYVPAYILFDTVDITLKSHSVPGVSLLTANELMAKRLRREFSDDYLKGAHVVAPPSADKQEWQFVTAACHLSQDLREWIGYIGNTSRHFGGVLFLPVEGEYMNALLTNQMAAQTRLSRALYRYLRLPRTIPTLRRPNAPALWHVVLLHNKVSGYRQMIFCNNKIAFTRLISDDSEQYGDVTAGNIEQEIENTLEYMARLSHGTPMERLVTIIASDEIIRHINPNRFNDTTLRCLTPYQCAKDLGLPNAAKEDDRYGDVLASCSISRFTPLLPLHTKQSMTLLLLSLTNTGLKIAGVILFLTMLCWITYESWILSTIKDGVDLSMRREAAAASDLEAFQKSNPIDVEKEFPVTEAVDMYTKLLGEAHTPFAMLETLRHIKPDNVIISSLRWMPVTEDTRQKKLTLYSLQCILDFHNPSQGFQRLFSAYEEFVSQVRSAFATYEVVSSKPSDKIDFSVGSETIPVTISIKGPLVKEGTS